MRENLSNYDCNADFVPFEKTLIAPHVADVKTLKFSETKPIEAYQWLFDGDGVPNECAVGHRFFQPNTTHFDSGFHLVNRLIEDHDSDLLPNEYGKLFTLERGSDITDKRFTEAANAVCNMLTDMCMPCMWVAHYQTSARNLVIKFFVCTLTCTRACASDPAFFDVYDYSWPDDVFKNNMNEFLMKGVIPSGYKCRNLV